MKIVIRNGLFETNSSSTHVLIIGMEDDWNKIGTTYMIYRGEIVPMTPHVSDLIKRRKEIVDLPYKEILDNRSLEEELSDIDESLRDSNVIIDIEEFLEKTYHSSDETFTTPSGEHIRVIGAVIED